jgi:hypothetical protein
MTDDNRKDDILVAQLTQRLNDFIERYDRDCGASSEWRRTVDGILKDQSKVLEEISPAYIRGKWIVALITIGSIGMAVKAFWSHLSWH